MKMDLNNSGLGTYSLARLSSQAFIQVLALVRAEDYGCIKSGLLDSSEDSHLVSDSAKAHEVFYTSLFDLVICDLSIPGASEFLTKISFNRTGLPVVVIANVNQLENALVEFPNLDFAWIMKEGGALENQLRAILLLTARRLERVSDEIEVQTERNAYWAATNCAPEGVAIISEDGTVIFSNDKFKIFADKISTQQSDVVELLRAKNLQVGDALLQQLTSASPGSIWQSEIQVPNDGDSPLYYEINLSVSDIGVNSGLVNSYLFESNLKRRVIWIKDITAQKIQEQFLRDLVSTTSHDLKGPLGAISNAAEMLSDGDASDNETIKILVDAIYSCSRKSIKVIEELLDCPSIKASALRLTKVAAPVESLVEEIVSDFEPTAMAKQLRITTRNIPSSVTVMVDKVAIYRALGNLLSNAIKFSRPGEKIEIAVLDDSDSYVSISFKDSGPGIAAQEMSQLFQRFGRLSRTKSVEGTGLGLFTVKNVIDAHEGRIEVESELGTGSIFTVFLPKTSN